MMTTDWRAEFEKAVAANPDIIDHRTAEQKKPPKPWYLRTYTCTACRAKVHIARGGGKYRAGLMLNEDYSPHDCPVLVRPLGGFKDSVDVGDKG